MCSILDIDLDYFNEVKEPTKQLCWLLAWAGRPVDLVVEKHHDALRHWRSLVKNSTLLAPRFILHIDEHHDMMDERATPNIANWIVHAMRTWPRCHVHWLVEMPIDSPQMWLSDETWEDLKPRFSIGKRRPRGWPKPNFVSVCTSPYFVAKPLYDQLLNLLESSYNK